MYFKQLSNMHSPHPNQRTPKHLLGICIAALALLFMTPELRANIVDDLFTFGAASFQVERPRHNGNGTPLGWRLLGV
jgi:hypothetical protein